MSNDANDANDAKGGKKFAPRRMKSRLDRAPRIRQIFKCALPRDAHLPEFYKTRPVVIMSPRATLSGVVLIVPLTTEAQRDAKRTVKLGVIPSICRHPEEESWACCRHIMTVAVSRLIPPPFKTAIPRVDYGVFQEIIVKALAGLPRPEAETKTSDDATT